MSDQYQDEAPPLAGGIQDDNSGAAPVPTNTNARVGGDVSPGGGIDDSGGTIQQGVGGGQAPSASPGFNPVDAGSADQMGGTIQQGVGGGQNTVDNQMGGRNRVASMVMGADAAPPQILEQAKRGVDPHNTQPPGNQVMMAIDAAVQKGDSKGAIALLQSARQGFNARQSFAYTALSGTAQKPADLNAAIDAANQAEQYVPDGSNVKFSHGRSGEITATVTMAGTDQPQNISLTPDQFKQFLNVGINHFDRMYSQTVPATLQQIASGRSAIVSAGGAPKPNAPAASGGGGDDGDDAATETPSKAVRTGQPQAMDVTQGDQPAKAGQFDANGHFIGKEVKSWADQQAERDTNGYGVELEKRSRSIFPDIGHEAERQQWMEAQEEKELQRKNAVDVAGEKGKWADKRAETMGGLRNKGIETAGQHSDYRADANAGASNYKADSNKGASDYRSDNRLKGDQYKADQQAKSAELRATVEAIKQGRIAANAADRNTAAMMGHEIANDITNPPTPEKLAEREAFMQRMKKNATQTPQVPSGQAAPPPSGKPAVPPSGKSLTVTQNGHTYTLQADGSYK